MKQYPQEQNYLKAYLKDQNIPHFEKYQQELIRNKVISLKQLAKKFPWFHNLMELLPFLIIAGLWYFLIFVLPENIQNKKFLFILIFSLHGVLGYQWVIYGLHEGAGHGLFKNKKDIVHKFFRFLAFHSSRLMMADPVYYQKNHRTHHQFTGTEKDGSQTNFVLLKRIIISLLPGAGIFFPNDYRIHKGDGLSLSLLISFIIGLGRFTLEYIALKPYFTFFEIITMLFFLSPWVGLSLDRIRESLEHHLMPQSKIYGTKELGLDPLALVIAGGPWGQPCHLSHHLAPDLNWYQQIRLSLYLNSILTDIQKRFFGFQTSFLKHLLVETKLHIRIEFSPQESSK